MLSPSSSTNFLRLIDLDELRRRCAASSIDSLSSFLGVKIEFEITGEGGGGICAIVDGGVALCMLAMRREMRFEVSLGTDELVVGMSTGIASDVDGD